MCKSKLLIALILVSSLLISVFTSSVLAEEKYEGMKIAIRTSDDVIPDFSVDAITAVLIGDDIEYRLYFTGGKDIEKYNMFNPPSGDKLQVIKEFSQQDIDNGYMSFRYPLKEILAFDVLTIFVINDPIIKSYYLEKYRINYTQVPRIIEFKDANVNKAVRAYLKKEGEIFDSELSGITELDLSDCNLSTIEDLELFTGLQELDLSNNSIADVSVLKNLKNLKKLYLKNNPINDYYQLKPIYDNLKDVDFKKEYARAVYAVKLKEIGVFKGTSGGFELNREPTRLEGLIMLIRLLGREADALAVDTSTSVYSDVPQWAVAYTNYAYTTGLTGGIGSNKFGSDQKLDARSYVTFILRALGYDDKKGDFTWENAVFAAQSIGLFDNPMQLELNNHTFLRAHIAELSYSALGMKVKGEEYTLIEKHINEDIIDRSLAEKLGFTIPEIVPVDPADPEL